MGTSVTRTLLAAAVAATFGTAFPSAHVPLRPPGSISVTVDLTVGGVPVVARAPGECRYASIASVPNTPLQTWSARRTDGGDDVNVTLWRLSQGDTFSLSVTAWGKTHRVSTGVPQGDIPHGAGTARFQQWGPRGQFQIDAVADTGATIRGTISCSAFTRGTHARA